MVLCSELFSKGDAKNSAAARVKGISSFLISVLPAKEGARLAPKPTFSALRPVPAGPSYDRDRSTAAPRERVVAPAGVACSRAKRDRESRSGRRRTQPG